MLFIDYNILMSSCHSWFPCSVFRCSPPGASCLADVVTDRVTAHVVPEVVPGPGEEEVMVLVHGEAVLVIWLSNFNHDMGDMGE